MKRLYLLALLAVLLMIGMVMSVYATSTIPAPDQPIVGGRTPTFQPDPFTYYDTNRPDYKSFIHDGRLGWFVGHAAVYPTIAGIFVYDIINEHEGELVLFAPIEDLDKAGESRFSQEVARTVGAEFRIFVLDTGEYQVNVGPDDDYWLYTVIWRDLDEPKDVQFVREDVCRLLGIRQSVCDRRRNPFTDDRREHIDP